MQFKSLCIEGVKGTLCYFIDCYTYMDESVMCYCIQSASEGRFSDILLLFRVEGYSYTPIYGIILNSNEYFVIMTIIYMNMNRGVYLEI